LPVYSFYCLDRAPAGGAKKKKKKTEKLKGTIKGTSSPKNVQTISFEGIHLKEFEGFYEFFSLYASGVTQHP
jgi:hypothetical protein